MELMGRPLKNKGKYAEKNIDKRSARKKRSKDETSEEKNVRKVIKRLEKHK